MYPPLNHIRLLRTVQTWLISVVEARQGLFDTEKGVAMFLYGMQGMS